MIQMHKTTQYLRSLKQITATTMWLSKCAISLSFTLSEHRFATQQFLVQGASFLEVFSPENSWWWFTSTCLFSGGLFSASWMHNCKRLHISEYLNENSAEILRTGIRTLIVFIRQTMKMLHPEKSGQYPLREILWLIMLNRLQTGFRAWITWEPEWWCLIFVGCMMRTLKIDKQMHRSVCISLFIVIGWKYVNLLSLLDENMSIYTGYPIKNNVDTCSNLHWLFNMKRQIHIGQLCILVGQPMQIDHVKS